MRAVLGLMCNMVASSDPAMIAEGDVAALRSQLMRLVNDAALRQQLAQRGRQRVLAHYTQAAIAQRHVAVYRHMLAM